MRSAPGCYEESALCKKRESAVPGFRRRRKYANRALVALQKHLLQTRGEVSERLHSHLAERPRRCIGAVLDNAVGFVRQHAYPFESTTPVFEIVALILCGIVRRVSPGSPVVDVTPLREIDLRSP